MTCKLFQRLARACGGRDIAVLVAFTVLLGLFTFGLAIYKTNAGHVIDAMGQAQQMEEEKP